MSLHVLVGIASILAVFPFLGQTKRWHLVHWWASKLLRILGVHVVVEGALPAAEQGGLLVANHVSWLDIHVLHSLLPVRFISKAEVKGWPVIGRLAEAAGTLFLERTRKADAARINQVMAGHLKEGDCLAFFPEGTTSDGSDLLPFYPSLFQPAVDAVAPVWPALIRYRHADGRPNVEAAYYGDMSLGQSLRAILRQPEIFAEIFFLPPISSAGLHRRDLAAQVEAAMRAAWVAAGRDNSPGTDARPPA